MIVCLASSLFCYLLKNKGRLKDSFTYALVFLLDLYTIFLLSSSKADNNCNIRFTHFNELMKMMILIIVIIKFNLSSKLFLVFIAYKAIVFSVIFCIKAAENNSTGKEVNYFEIFVFLINCLIASVFNNYRNEFMNTIEDLFSKYKFSNDYLISLLNSVKKSYLSINLSQYSINSNSSFKILLNNMGISEDKVNWFLESNLENNDLNDDELIRIKKTITANKNQNKVVRNNSIAVKNINTSDRIYLKKKTDDTSNLNVNLLNKIENKNKKKDLKNFNQKIVSGIGLSKKKFKRRF